MDTAWWIPLVSAATGAVVGGGLVLLTEKYRWDRDREARREVRRLDAYSAFLGETLLARTPTEWSAVGGRKHVLTHRRQALRTITMGYARLNLVAGDDVKDAADAMASAAAQDIEAITGQVSRWNPIAPGPSEERQEEFRRLRIAFERAVRKERGETE